MSSRPSGPSISLIKGLTMSIAALYRAFNVELLDYPLEASIRQSLIFADEICVVVGQSKDRTLGIVTDLQSEYGPDRVKIQETEITLDRMWQVKCADIGIGMTDCDWIMFMDADEAFHEDDAGKIKEASTRGSINFVRFPYRHFYGTPGWVVPPRNGNFYTHHTKMGRKNRNFRLQNFRHDHNIAPTCDMVADVNGRETKMHIYHGSDILDLKVPVYHYGHCRLPGPQAIRRVIGDGWYTNDPRYLKNHVPEVEGDFDYQLKKNLPGLDRFTDPHPMDIQTYWMLDEPHQSFWGELEAAL